MLRVANRETAWKIPLRRLVLDICRALLESSCYAEELLRGDRDGIGGEEKMRKESLFKSLVSSVKSAKAMLSRQLSAKLRHRHSMRDTDPAAHING